MDKFSFILKIYYYDTINNNYDNNDFDLMEINTIKYKTFKEFINCISKKLNINKIFITKITYNNPDLEKPIEIKDNMSVDIFYNNIKINDLTQILNIYLSKKINLNDDNNNNHDFSNNNNDDDEKNKNKIIDELIIKYQNEIKEKIFKNYELNDYSGNICSQCKEIIYGNTFKCSECENFYLCNKCFNVNKIKNKHKHKFYVE